jgi:hypothetical protein
MELVSVPSNTTVGDIAKSRRCAITSVWLPLTTKVTVDSNEPFVVYDSSSDALTVNRNESFRLLGLLVLRPDVFSFNPTTVPQGRTCYLQCSPQSGSRKVAAGTVVMVRPLELQAAVEEGSATALESRRALYEDPKTGASDLRQRRQTGKAPSAPDSHSEAEDNNSLFSDAYISTLIDDEVIRRRRQREESADDDVAVARASEEAIAAAKEVADMSAHRRPRSGLITEMISSLKRSRTEVPLHNAQCSGTVTVKVGNTIWLRHDPRILTLFHNGDAQVKAASSTDPQPATVGCSTQQVGQSSSLVAAFFVDGGVIRTSLFQRGPSSWTLADDRLPDRLRRLSLRGYRVVLLAHYSSLHHGNAANLAEKCGRIGQLIEWHLADVPLTVVISLVSNVTGPDGHLSLYALPKSGLWSYFISKLNDGVTPDPERSFIVGGEDAIYLRAATGRISLKCRDEEGRVSEAMPDYLAGGSVAEQLFATNCGVKYVCVQQLLEEAFEGG